VKAFFQAIVSISAFIAYASRRDWLITTIGSVWAVGFFEGACAMIIVFYLADKYGDVINETYLGLRELGRLRKSRQKTKTNQ